MDWVLEPQGSLATVTRLPLLTALRLGPDVWQRAGAGGSPFTSWEWHQAWADAAPAHELAAAEVLVARDPKGRPAALLPVRSTRVPFRRTQAQALVWAIGDTGCPDNLDLPAAAGTNVATLALALDSLDWDAILLDNLASEAPNMDALAAACVALGWSVRTDPLRPCPVVELPHTWEAYLQSLSASRRQTLLRKERRLFREHDVAVVDWHGTALERGWAVLKTLHDRRWLGQGVFNDPRMDALHRRFVTLMDARSELWLVSVQLDGVPAAAWYGFARGDAVFFYQSGREPDFEHTSVGAVLMGLMVRRAIERGYRRFELLRGDEPYKAQWSNGVRWTRSLTVFRSSLRGRMLQGLDRVVRAVRSSRVSARLDR